jgi:hypothetical protein
MMFYQGILLIGYGYAHLSTKYLTVRRQILLHGAVAALALVVLPIRISPSATASIPVDSNPIPWLIGFLTVATALPLLAISATAPLLQRWFSHSGHRQAQDPYFLYAASNAGSMLGLLAYPLVIEPTLTLKTQSWVWLAGYGALAILTLICGSVLWRLPAASAPAPAAEPAATGADVIPMSRRLRWILLAFVPSSLMLGVTTYLTTDVAPFPLLWVLPLALYILTFIIVFARRAFLPGRWFGRATSMLAILVVVTFILGPQHAPGVVLGMHLLFLFMASMVCHGALAGDRPPPSALTEFYFCLAFGGVLGGIFNAIIAPQIFHDIYEYPLIVLLACAVRPAEEPGRRGWLNWFDLAWGIGTALLMVVMIRALQWIGFREIVVNVVLMFGVPALLAYAWIKRPVRFGLCLAAIYGLGLLYTYGRTHEKLVERNFFGVLRITDSADHRFRDFLHGTTLHGRSRLDPAQEKEPTAYYHRHGPVGQFFTAFDLARTNASVAVIGLGSGGLSAYARPTEDWLYYEIDPDVARIANNRRWFPFMHTTVARKMNIALGDARLQFRYAEAGEYDLIILDAFSSDSIPLHLITREAVRLYLDKLSPHGILLFHISNRRLDLAPVVANLASDAHLACRLYDYPVVHAPDLMDGLEPSEWAVLARNDADFGSLADKPHWRVLPPDSQRRLWTDDFSNVLQVLRWN